MAEESLDLVFGLEDQWLIHTEDDIMFRSIRLNFLQRISSFSKIHS